MPQPVTSVAGFAMTWVLHGVRCMAGGRPRGSPLQRVTRSALRAGGQGRPPLRICGNACVGWGYKRCGKTGRRGRRPLRRVTRGAVGGPMWASAPTEALVGADDPVRPVPVTQHFVGQGPCALPGVRGKNPPVTALPCQPPLGKGAKGTGVADCHGQCAHWLRNDRVSMECGAWQAGDREGRPYGGLQGVPCGRAVRGVRPYGYVETLA